VTARADRLAELKDRFSRGEIDRRGYLASLGALRRAGHAAAGDAYAAEIGAAQRAVLAARGVLLPAEPPKPSRMKSPRAATRRARRASGAKRAPAIVAVPEPKREFTPGLPSLVGGVGSWYGQSPKKKVLERPSSVSPEALTAIDTAVDWNPEVSYGAWVYQLMGLDAWKLEVTDGGDSPISENDPLYLDTLAFVNRVALAYGGGIEALLAVGMDSVIRRGGIAAELDIADSLDDVVDVDFVDPALVDFEQVESNDRRHKSLRPVYCPPSGDPIPFPDASFRHFPLGARIGKPHGKSPFLPVVDTAYPHAELRDSIQRVAKNQGFSRLALVYAYESVVRSAPPDVVRIKDGGAYEVLDWEKLKAHIEAFRADLQHDLEEMFADDNWVLPDMIKPDSIGAKHAAESFNFLQLAQLFDQDVIASIKGQPAIHGRQWGSDLSSTGSVQWQVQARGIEALRDLPARAVEWIINQWYLITGRRARAELVFEPLRKEDRKAEAEAGRIEAERAIMLRDAGFIDDDEGAQMTVGHDATGERAEPTTVAGGGANVPPAGVMRGSHTVTCGVCGHQQDLKHFGENVLEYCAICGEVLPERGAPPAGAEPGAAGYYDHSHEPPPQAGGARPHADRGNGHRFEPFVPSNPDAAGPIELNQDPPPGAADAERVRRAFDRWAESEAPTFVGMYAAVVVEREAAAGRAPHTVRTGQTLPADAWQWDPGIARWRYPPKEAGKLGRILPPDRADTLFERRLDQRRKEGIEITERLLAGRISVREWQEAMKPVLKDTHLEARMIAVGGKNAMSPTDYGAAGGRIGHVYTHLGSVGQQIAGGELSQGQIRAWVGRRFEAESRETYRRGREYVHLRAGYREERNNLEPGAAHCNGCEAETARGWVPIGSIIEIGGRECRTGCKCRLEYRLAEDQTLPELVMGGVPA